MGQIVGQNSAYRARGTSASELRDAVRNKFFPRDISVQAELGKRRVSVGRRYAESAESGEIRRNGRDVYKWIHPRNLGTVKLYYNGRNSTTLR